ncbi:unnamed protein product [Pocillopora meandrina]|uniref:DDE Tnp4 domain-containing protein n=1 Tax=Pocillopora meandrina TaxID=46732 RepID=A0AAU9X0V4_9CNID|nr:unnamed protein product [Pocillopora meandrina]
MRAPVSVEERVGLALWRITIGNSFRSCGLQFEKKSNMSLTTSKYGIPQIVGVIDGCHIEINGPSRNHDDYFNRKHHYSVVLQGIVNCDLKFFSCICRLPMRYP